MKQKVGTLLEQDIVRRAKRRAAEENRPLSDVIQDALERYLSEGDRRTGAARRGLSAFLRAADAARARAVEGRARTRQLGPQLTSMNLDDISTGSLCVVRAIRPVIRALVIQTGDLTLQLAH